VRLRDNLHARILHDVLSPAPGGLVRLGSARVRGNTTFEQEILLGQTPVRRALLNYNYDVLALEER
jgi:hypothetical protein